MMNKVYGYCRISRNTQNIDRQIRNIKEEYKDVIIVQEAYTGTKIQGRKEFEKLLKVVNSGDTIVFDSVSRMARNAEEGIEIYEKLFNKDIELVFLKEPQCNTRKYKEALNKQIDIRINTGDNHTDKFMIAIIDALNEFQMDLAKKDIELAFAQAQKEVEDLRQRTKEGLETAKLNGKQIGNEKGVKLTTKKSIKAKEEIKAKAKDFGGSYTDTDLIKVLGITRNTYYKYKRELVAELNK